MVPFFEHPHHPLIPPLATQMIALLRPKSVACTQDMRVGLSNFGSFVDITMCVTAFRRYMTNLF